MKSPLLPSGAAENAEEQNLVAVRCHQLVRKRKNGKIFHDQIGHWISEPGTGMIVHSLSIPRARFVLAGGTLSGTARRQCSGGSDRRQRDVWHSPVAVHAGE